MRHGEDSPKLSRAHSRLNTAIQCAWKSLVSGAASWRSGSAASLRLRRFAPQTSFQRFAISSFWLDSTLEILFDICRGFAVDSGKFFSCHSVSMSDDSSKPVSGAVSLCRAFAAQCSWRSVPRASGTAFPIPSELLATGRPAAPAIWAALRSAVSGPLGLAPWKYGQREDPLWVSQENLFVALRQQS